MRTTRRRLFRRGRHDGGASAVEYALILAGVALVGVATLFLLGRTAKAAFVDAQNQVAAPPAGVLPAVSGSTSAAPTTTSAGPTTTSPAPTTTTARPSASPTTTRSPINITVNGTGTNTILDLNLSNNPTNTSVSMVPDIGDVYWDGDRIRINPAGNTPDNTVTVVTYTYTSGGVTYTGTITVRVNT